MPKVTLIFEGRETEVEVSPGTNLLEAADEAGAKMGHACGGVCACSTCHVWVRKGFDTLVEADDREEDILDRAFDVKPTSRLGCQAEVTDADVVAEITPESLQAWYDEHPNERRERDERLRAEGREVPAPARDLRKG